MKALLILQGAMVIYSTLFAYFQHPLVWLLIDYVPEDEERKQQMFHRRGVVLSGFVVAALIAIGYLLGGRWELLLFIPMSLAIHWGVFDMVLNALLPNRGLAYIGGTAGADKWLRSHRNPFVLKIFLVLIALVTTNAAAMLLERL